MKNVTDSDSNQGNYQLVRFDQQNLLSVFKYPVKHTLLASPMNIPRSRLEPSHSRVLTGENPVTFKILEVNHQQDLRLTAATRHDHGEHCLAEGCVAKDRTWVQAWNEAMAGYGRRSI